MESFSQFISNEKATFVGLRKSLYFDDEVQYESEDCLMLTLNLKLNLHEKSGYSSNEDDSGISSDESFNLDEGDEAFIESDATGPYNKKRASPCDETEDSPTKRQRLVEAPEEVQLENVHDTIKAALDQDDEELIGDMSRPYSLPTIRGKHHDLKAISSQTVSELLTNELLQSPDKVTIVDCRYPYEYEGGHIEGAVNIWDQNKMAQQFFEKCSQHENQRQIVIFHCEFSSERGPKMARFLRQLDREANKESYPALHYPEVYLMEGGYKAFHQSCQHLCQPRSYMPMDHQSYRSELKYFRSKSKSSKASRQGRRIRHS